MPSGKRKRTRRQRSGRHQIFVCFYVFLFLLISDYEINEKIKGRDLDYLRKGKVETDFVYSTGVSTSFIFCIKR